MDEIADLIRLLAEAPAEEPPMSRPREFLNRIAIEKVAQEGVTPEGPAVPLAAWNFQKPVTGGPADPSSPPPALGAVANPRTGIPVAGTPAIPMPVEVTSVGPAKVMAPETFTALTATPVILDRIAGLPAEVRQRETVSAVASPTPRARVTITVPPAFQDVYQDLFTAVDEELDLPPRQSSAVTREIRANVSDLKLESTEAFVARAYESFEGGASDLDRWSL
jgi:hypothetical protein